jgi:hypothetical protein
MFIGHYFAMKKANSADAWSYRDEICVGLIALSQIAGDAND